MSSSSPPTPRRAFLSLPQLNCLTLNIILAATGAVPLGDIALSLLSIPYTFLLSRFVFPSPPSPPPPVFPRDFKPLRIYVSVGGILGLLLPVVYVLYGVLYGDRESAQAASPHLFLLTSQVFMEGVSFSQGFALPVRVFVPVVYNAHRLSAISAWLQMEAGKEGARAGMVLAGLNMAFWSFNLFGFLVPVYLPKAFKMHFGSSDAKRE